MSTAVNLYDAMRHGANLESSSDHRICVRPTLTGIAGALK